MKKNLHFALLFFVTIVFAQNKQPKLVVGIVVDQMKTEYLYRFHSDFSENCFKHLDAPVMRCASADTPIPFSQELEQQFLAKSRLHDAIRRLINY